MSEYKITLSDGTTLEAPSLIDVCHMYHAVQDTEPVAYLGDEALYLDDFVERYERKASHSNYSDIERAVYTDVAEKLAVLNNGGQLTESI
jgi:hypothetical protein